MGIVTCVFDAAGCFFVQNLSRKQSFHKHTKRGRFSLLSKFACIPVDVQLSAVEKSLSSLTAEAQSHVEAAKSAMDRSAQAVEFAFFMMGAVPVARHEDPKTPAP
jgi:hypothetical protein